VVWGTQNDYKMPGYDPPEKMSSPYEHIL
jgi:hypothetical protein